MSLLTKDRDSAFLFKSPGERVINSVIGEGFDHTYISFTDSCFQIEAHLLSTKKKSPTRIPKPHSTKKKIPEQKRRGKDSSFLSLKIKEKVPYFFH